MRCERRCTTCTSSPRSSRPRAASRPSNPPPITAARVAPGTKPIIRSQSSSVRKANSPSFISVPWLLNPLSGGTNGLLPVANHEHVVRLEHAGVATHELRLAVHRRRRARRSAA